MEPARNSIESLVGLEKIKVWSLIVSLFGDLDKSGSQSLSGKQINSILSHIGIKPEATRVALHRLKNENWIETSRVGRETHYRMSRKAALQTSEVYNAVYGTSVKYPDGWCLNLSQENDHPIKAGHVSIFRNVFLVPVTAGGSNPKNLAIKLDGNDFPDWFEEKIASLEVREIACKLTNAVFTIDQEMDVYSSLDRMAVRLLVLHSWRKMALRDNIWCHIWLFQDGSLAQCQRIVPQFLDKMPKIDPTRLSS